ncbi:hypothetical protein M0804_002729 [Polistes exclamans]|nr:hypothetical protein M0804_002729 [Polistes exclamans]
MLIRWKSKDKSSTKSSSTGSAGKKKRKFGREDGLIFGNKKEHADQGSVVTSETMSETIAIIASTTTASASASAAAAAAVATPCSRIQCCLRRLRADPPFPLGPPDPGVCTTSSSTSSSTTTNSTRKACARDTQRPTLSVRSSREQ